MKQIYHAVTFLLALTNLLFPAIGRAQETLFLGPVYAINSNPVSVVVSDLNGDGVVDIADFGILVNNYDRHGNP